MGDEKKDHRIKWGLFIAIAVSAASLGVFAMMAMMTVPSADDFWYRYFLDGGISNYLSLMKLHYLTFNGRVLVHVADHIVLHFGNWCFALTGVMILTFIPVALTLASGRKKRCLIWAMAIFLPAVLSLPRSIMNQGILWISAFFNYVLPTAMLTAEVLLFELPAGRRRAGFFYGALCVLWSVFCGATTEQSGLAAVLLTAYFLVKALIKKRGRLTAALAFSGSAAGLASIFMSPATRARLGYGAKLGGIAEIVSTMYQNMGPCAEELCSSWLAPAALAAFFLLAGAAARGRLSKKWPLALSLLPGLSSVAAPFCPEGLRTALFVALCFAAALAAAVLIASGEEAAGILAAAGLATFAAILVTDSFGGRTLVPFLLTLTAADAVLLSSYVSRPGDALRGLPCAALLALGLAAAIPFMGGMRENLRVERENLDNLDEARRTGVFRYCIDYNMDYTRLKLQTGFMNEYLAGEGLPADTEVRYYSYVRPAVTANGVAHYPAYVTEDGETLLWIRVVEAFGGEIVIRPGEGCITVVLPWARCDIDPVGDTGSAVFTRTDGETYAGTYRSFSTESRTWFPLEAFSEMLDFEVTYDAEKNTYSLSAPDHQE